MAVCDITSGRLRECKQSLGGVQTLYLFNYVADPFTVVAGEATAINPLLTVVYEYQMDGNGKSLAETMVSDSNTGTTVNTQTITAVLKKIDAATGLEMNLLAYSNPQAVIKDNNGVYSCVGVTLGIDFTVAQTTGSAKAELNGYTLTGISEEGGLSPKLSATAITAFLALVV